jgi:hypothetical protein
LGMNGMSSLRLRSPGENLHLLQSRQQMVSLSQDICCKALFNFKRDAASFKDLYIPVMS